VFLSLFIFFMLIFFLVIIGLSFLILAHEAAHFFAAKIFKLKVHEFGFGFPPRITAKKIGDTEYSLNWLPFGGFVRIAGERGEFDMVRDGEDATNGEGKETDEKRADVEEGTSPPSPLETRRLFFAQPAWKKSLILLAGVMMNFILGWLLISGTLMIGTPRAIVITDVETGSPAAAAGLQTGDALQGYGTSQAFIDFVNAHRGQPIALHLLRNAKDINLTITPRVVTKPNEGAIGIGLADAGAPREAPLSALGHGFTASIGLFGTILVAFGSLAKQIFVHATLPQGVVGPVGIFGVAQETGKIGLVYLLQFIGIISINLAVVNLIPFPALDGGRFLMVVIEKIKGSPVPKKLELWVNGLGFAFLLLLMALLTVRDVWNLW
jgi:regulator of sigma E protease